MVVLCIAYRTKCLYTRQGWLLSKVSKDTGSPTCFGSCLLGVLRLWRFGLALRAGESESTTRAPGCAAASLLHRRTLLPHLLPTDTLSKQNLVSRRAKGQCMSASRRAHGQLESPRTGNHISDHYVAMKIGGMRYPRLVSVYESKSLACSLESERTYTGERNADRFR